MIKRFCLLSRWLIIAVAGLLPAPVWAQTPDANVDFYAVQPASDQPYTVGDRITLRLEVRHSKDSQVELPKLDTQWGDFEVISQTGQDTVANNDGTATTRKDIVVTVFKPGDYQTPPLLVTHTKAGGAQPEELSAPVVPLKISSVLKEGDDQLRDLKAQAVLPVPPLWPLFLAGVVLAAALLGGGYLAGNWAYRRWRRTEPLAEAPMVVLDTRPPEIIAFTELERIAALDLPAQNQLKHHYSLVADCLRDYIERRYRITALEQTTDELRQSFRRSTVPVAIAQNFVDLFTRSDLVKFARFNPSQADAYQYVPEARAIVQLTTPPPEPEPALQPEPAGEAVR